MKQGLVGYRSIDTNSIECKIVNMFTQKESTVIIKATSSQVQDWLAGSLIQNAFPQLTSSERELLITGVGEEEWDLMFN